MRFLLSFILIVVFFTSCLNAQDKWVDYLVGRPDLFYLDAKRAVAKGWGIIYTTEMAGCIDCENTRQRAQELRQQNHSYFKCLELRYGQNWLAHFNKAVAKKHNFLLAQHRQEEGVWHELLQNNGDSEYYSVKKEVAAEWGITYKTLFVDYETLNPLKKERLRQQFEKNIAYQKELQNRLGDQWMNWIDQESKLRLLQKTVPQGGTWTDVVWGEPSSSYYKAKAIVAKRWGINYKTCFMGSKRTTVLINKQRDLMRQNAVYFSSLNNHFKFTWLVAFYREVQQAYAQTEH